MAAAASVVAAACAITPPGEQWEQLGRQPSAPAVTPAASVTRLRATELPVEGSLVLEITRQDPLVALDDRVSPAKLLRFSAPRPGAYDVTVDSWCHPCPATAILWGALDLPVFVPQLLTFDAGGAPLATAGGTPQPQERLMRNIPLRTTWRLRVEAAGPCYLLITSKARGPLWVGSAGNTADFIASPLGKIRVRLAPAKGVADPP